MGGIRSCCCHVRQVSTRVHAGAYVRLCACLQLCLPTSLHMPVRMSARLCACLHTCCKCLFAQLCPFVLNMFMALHTALQTTFWCAARPRFVAGLYNDAQVVSPYLHHPSGVQPSVEKSATIGSCRDCSVRACVRAGARGVAGVCGVAGALGVRRVCACEACTAWLA